MQLNMSHDFIKKKLRKPMQLVLLSGYVCVRILGGMSDLLHTYFQLEITTCPFTFLQSMASGLAGRQLGPALGLVGMGPHQWSGLAMTRSQSTAVMTAPGTATGLNHVTWETVWVSG